MPDSLDDKLDAIARHPFRAKFQLRGRDRVTAELRGLSTLQLDARDLIASRLALGISRAIPLGWSSPEELYKGLRW